MLLIMIIIMIIESANHEIGELWVRFLLGAPDFFQHLFCCFSLRHIRVSLSDDEPNNDNQYISFFHMCTIKSDNKKLLFFVKL